MSEPNKAAQQLATLFPEPKVISIAGVDVRVNEMSVRKIARFAEFLAPVLARYPDGADVTSFLQAAGMAVIDGVAFAVDQSVDWVGGLPAKEFDKLLRALQETNPDFFVTAVGRLVSVSMAMLSTAAPAGLMLFSTFGASESPTPAPAL